MNLKLAIQKSGRLHDESIKLLKDCGLSIRNGKNQLRAQAKGFPAEILYLRNSDIPKYLENGVADISIIGENTLIEKQADVEILEKLGFSPCRLSIAIPKDDNTYTGPASLDGKKIATSYPNTLRAYLDEKGIHANIHIISGSVEIAPNIGLANAICDLVSSGSTLFENNLVEAEVILRSEACLAVNRKALKEKKELVNGLLFRVRSVLKARKHRYILMNVPNEAIEKIGQILPVLRSPTVLPLLEEGWSSVHSVISEEDFWPVITELKSCGAQGILVIPIEKMVI